MALENSDELDNDINEDPSTGSPYIATTIVAGPLPRKLSEVVMPKPTSVKLSLRRLARCSGLFNQPDMIEVELTKP